MAQIYEMLPPPPPVLPGWKRTTQWVDVGEPIKIGRTSTLTIGCRLAKGGVKLVANVSEGKKLRVHNVGRGEALPFSGAWIVLLSVRAISKSASGVPRRVLLEVVPTGQNPARSLAELSGSTP